MMTSSCVGKVTENDVASVGQSQSNYIEFLYLDLVTNMTPLAWIISGLLIITFVLLATTDLHSIR